VRCVTNTNVRQYTYLEFLQHYVWSITMKRWTLKWIWFSLGRLYFANPIVGGGYQFQLFLTIVWGTTSFEDLRIVHGHIYNTFKEACLALGLLEDDKKWTECL
jgi:hypothetical protein